MSDRRLLLDGPDLQALLARAAELGGQVVRAERVRKGLFGRQWYEVTVVVPELSGAPTPVARRPGAATPRREPAPPSRRQRPAGIADLISAAEAAERMDSAAARKARAAGKRSAK